MTDVEARLRAADPLPRDQLEQLYGADVFGRLLSDIRTMREGHMTETTDRREPETNRKPPTDEQIARLVPERSSGFRPGIAVAAAAIVIAVGIAAALLLINSRDPDVAGAPAEIGDQFVAAYVDYDFDAAATYLAPDLEANFLRGVQDDSVALGQPSLPADNDVRFAQAIGAKTVVEPCEEVGTEAGATLVQCGYAYHSFRSDELGRGPFAVDSFYSISVKDGEVVAFEDHHSDEPFYDPDGFSKQMWEPFATWMGTTHPDQLDILYDPYPNGWRITEESIPLWEQYLDEWAAEVKQGS